MLPPLAAAWVNSFAVPEMLTSSAGEYAPTPNGAPVRRWQSMQWQAMTTLDGPSGTESVRAPQLHLASPIEKVSTVSRPDFQTGTLPQKRWKNHWTSSGRVAGQ